MLEWTAAGLESGHLHRVLPRSTRPQSSVAAARHLKQPRSSFTQNHGRHSIARRAGAQAVAVSQGSEPSPLLDFLYPKRTHPLLRRQSFPSVPLRSRSHGPACSAAQRRYESSDSSNRFSDQASKPPATKRDANAPAEAEEERSNRFDRTQWQDSGDTIQPRRTYVTEEDDDQPRGDVNPRHKRTAHPKTGSLATDDLDAVEDFEIRLKEKRRGKPRWRVYRYENYTPYEDPMVDQELEKDVKQSLREQIMKEQEMDRELEESDNSNVELGETDMANGQASSTGHTIDQAIDPIGQQVVAEAESDLDMADREDSIHDLEKSEATPEQTTTAEGPSDQGEQPVVQQDAGEERPKFGRPLYQLPKSERLEDDASANDHEAPGKRKNRFGQPELDEQPEEALQPVVEVLGAEEAQDKMEIAQPEEQAEPGQSELPQRTLTFHEMLEDVDGAHYLAVYNAYVRLDEAERDPIRPRVITYLAKSRSVVEAGRVKNLFRQTSAKDWTNEMLSAIILVFLRTDEQTQAFNAFRTGLREWGLTGGFDYLLIDTINKHQWHMALDVWLVYCKDLAEREPGRTPDAAMLKPFSLLNSLGGLYFLFERYLAVAERKVERFLDNKPLTKQALWVFRRAFAKAALDSRCPPTQARTILDWWYNPRLYEKYIWDVSHHKAKSDTASELIPIYEDLRVMSDVKISTSALSCIFRACYPDNAQTLEQVHEDWVRMHGDLDSWGYKKFMKFYSHQGDAERVKALWEKYIKLFPGELKSTQSFASILNAYAQTGDTGALEDEMLRMSTDYGIQPDVSLMNTKLKCYMRAGDYLGTLACFRDILIQFKPDNYTYAHLMAMCAKKGDIDQAVSFFNAAQDRRVSVNKEMVLALVVAYCGLNQVHTAQDLARRLADVNITSAAIWNQLIVHHARNSQLGKCYQVLDEMRERRVDWDRDTLDYLLQALTQVKQTGPAYLALKRATQEKSAIVQPDHYSTVMIGAARNRDVASADSVYELLTKANIPVPFNAMVAYTDLMLVRKPNAQRTPTLPRQMVESFRRLVAELEDMDVTKRRQQSKRVAWCIQLLNNFGAFDGIEEVVSLYTQLFPEYKDGRLPPDILASLMQGYQRDENFTRIIHLWDQAWPRFLAERTQPTGKGIYPAHEYDLDRIIYRVADAYRALAATKPLASIIRDVHEAGFKLTTNTWDRVIGAFALTGNWKVGVHWCETVLMKNWAGWTRRLTPRERQARQNPRHLWPQRRTILQLREGWIAERQLAAWSGNIARALLEQDIDYPRTINAFRDALEPEVAGGPWIISRKLSMEQLLKPLPLRELRIMEKELRRFLDEDEDLATSPFKKVDRWQRLRSLDREEMMRLKGLLDRILPVDGIWDLEEEQDGERGEGEVHELGDSASG